ncbi:MAG TPA: SIR2 family protein [Pirellulales bacterium]|jgi:tetratricopeptide (TPR) repeat protein
MTFPATLLSSLRDGKVIPFVGAGVSRALLDIDGMPLFPTWSELLDRAADRLDKEGKADYASLVRSLIRIDKPNFLDAAKYAKDGLEANWFSFLKDQLDYPRDAVLNQSLDLPQSIWRLGSNLVLTTNYDRAMTWAHSRPEDLSRWNIESPAEQAAMARSGLSRPVVWHLHGTIEDAARIILTPDGYSRLYPSKDTEALYTAAMTSLRSLLTSQSLLFIGFSFTDSFLGTTLRGVSESFANANGPHYALVHRDNSQAQSDARRCGVQVITFSDYGEPLLQAVSELAAAAAETRSLVMANAAHPTDAPAEVEPVCFDDVCDTPPPTGTWVGRELELKLLANRNAKAIAITGIGGQGKSTLVAKYLAISGAEYQFVDWRDCKEQDDTLQTHLVRIVERLSRGRSCAADLASETIESVVRLFLDLAVSVRGIFVFDNVDHYIDLQTSQAVKGMHALIQGILKTPSASRFVFTARPKLRYDSSEFVYIELKGLTIDDAKELFAARGVQIAVGDLGELHDLLQGHPLWIALIANQVVTNRIKIPVLISRIKNGRDAELPTTMLREIWRGLRSKQQRLLRYLAELVRPETVAQLEELVAHEFSCNQFRATLERLKTLDLVVIKSPNVGADTVELHPLVREFIRREFPRGERNRFISAILVYFDKIIVKLRPSLSRRPTFDTLQYWTAKVELLVNSGNYHDGLLVLYEAANALVFGGFSEDFVRLANSVLSILNWSDSEVVDSIAFEYTCENLVEVLSQLGRFDEAEFELARFERTTAGATARYICVCRLRVYLYWSKGEFDLAKEWGRRGVALKIESHLDTRHDCGHELALAQRDSGERENALKYFLRGVALEEVLNPAHLDASRGGDFYGNVGRTLQLMGRDDEAMIAIIKSAWILEYDERPMRINVAWASEWLGELLERKGNRNSAYVCFRRAAAKWKGISPYRAQDAIDAAERLGPIVDGALAAVGDEQIEHKYLVWLEGEKRF